MVCHSDEGRNLAALNLGFIHWRVVAFALYMSYFLLRSQKKVTKEKSTPLSLIPCVARLNGQQSETRFAQTAACQELPLRLRYSAWQQE